MRLNEAAGFLLWQRDQVKVAINEGIELPKSKVKVKIKAIPLEHDYDIAESDLEEFIQLFEREEPGRHPPLAVRRELLVESSHRCPICDSTSSFEYHHIIEFSELKHHDPKHMMLLCANCHGRCTKGEIDVVSQRTYKDKLRVNGNGYDDTIFPVRFSWDELHDVVVEVHKVLSTSSNTTNSKYDRTLVDLDEKNRLNRLGKDYFETMLTRHQPYLGRVKEFLSDPVNSGIAELYYELVDELNLKISAERDKFERFEQILIEVYNSAKPALKGKLSTLSIFLTFMYFECDIGRKK